MDIYQRMKELNLVLPELPPKGGIYMPVKKVGNTIYVSGQGPTEKGLPVITGKVGGQRTVEEGKEAARMCVMNALSTLDHYFGDLNQIKGLVKMLAFVSSTDDFVQQPKVVDGASQLLADIFGDAGIGARSAIGVNALPGDITVEIEFIFEV